MTNTNTVKATLVSAKEVFPGVTQGLLQMEDGKLQQFAAEGKTAASILRVYLDTTMNVVLEGVEDATLLKLTWFSFRLPRKAKQPQAV